MKKQVLEELEFILGSCGNNHYTTPANDLFCRQ